MDEDHTARWIAGTGCGNPRGHESNAHGHRGHITRSSSTQVKCLSRPSATSYPLFSFPTPPEEMLQNRQDQNCNSGGGTDSHFHLRIGSIFVILIGATSGAVFPMLAKRSKRINLPPYFFEYVHPLPLACLSSTDRVQVCKVLRVWCHRTSENLAQPGMCPEFRSVCHRLHPSIVTSSRCSRFTMFA